MDLLLCLAFGGGFTFFYINMEANAWIRVISWLPDMSAVKGLIPQSVPILLPTANLENAKSLVRGLASPLQRKATSAATAISVYSAPLSGKRNTGIAKLKTGARRKYYINLSYPLMKGGV